MTANASVLYEVRDGIAWITLSRPEALNALNAAVGAGLEQAWTDFSENPDARVAVLSGAGGRALSAGADLKERVVTDQRGGDVRWAHGLRERTMRKPVIAAINGYCPGGGFELALSYDIRIATPSARLGLPEIQRSYFPGGGGPMRLARMIPLTSAMEILLAADPRRRRRLAPLAVRRRSGPHAGRVAVRVLVVAGPRDRRGVVPLPVTSWRAFDATAT